MGRCLQVGRVGFGCRTLLYVACSEIIPEEFTKTGRPGMKMAFLAFGYLFIVATQTFDTD